MSDNWGFILKDVFPLSTPLTPVFRVLDLIQNSDEWINYRKRKIGASDAPIIMGVSPYKTVKELFDEKIGVRDPAIAHYGMKRGHELEPIALRLYNFDKDTRCVPLVLESTIYPEMMASFDGFDLEKLRACEIKSPNQVDHDIAKLGQVPPKYMPQLQHQMLVAGLQKMDYVSFRDNDIAVVTVLADVDYQKSLVATLQLFALSLNKRELHESFHKAVIRSPAIDALFEELKALRLEIKERVTPLQEREEALKKALIALANDDTVYTHTCAIVKRVRTSYDYKKLASDYKADLEAYKKETTYFDIRERKDEC